MSTSDLIAAYNYDTFTAENTAPWTNFEGSPPLGEVAPGFPLWRLDGAETSFSLLLAENRFTVVEFGSYT